jgi:hypothetical protein
MAAFRRERANIQVVTWENTRVSSPGCSPDALNPLKKDPSVCAFGESSIELIATKPAKTGKT